MNTYLIFIFKRNNLLLKFLRNIFFFFFDYINLLKKFLKNVACIKLIISMHYYAFCLFEAEKTIRTIVTITTNFHKKSTKIWQANKHRWKSRGEKTTLAMHELPVSRLPKLLTQPYYHPATFQSQVFQRPDFVFFLPIPWNLFTKEIYEKRSQKMKSLSQLQVRYMHPSLTYLFTYNYSSRE